MRGLSLLALTMMTATARGQGYGSPLRQAYYLDDPADSVCSSAGRHCSIVECEDVRTFAGCACLLVFPNGARQPLSPEQCRAASMELPHLPSNHFKALPVVQPNAECRWHSKEGTSTTECRYQCSGSSSVVKLTLPSGMVRCPGEEGAVLPWGQIQGVVTNPSSSAASRTGPIRASAPASDTAKTPRRKKDCYCICGDPKGRIIDRKPIGRMREDECRSSCVWDHRFPEGQYTCQ